MKSTLPLTAVAAAAVLTMSACAGSGSGATTKLEFQTALGADNVMFSALEEAADEFESENPGVSIDVIPQASSYESDMKVRLAAGDVPDILGTHGWSLLRYSDFLEPLQDEAWAADVNPALDEAMRGPGGELYALPLDTDVAGIIVNTDVLDSVGATVDDLRTWDDFTEVSEKIAATGVTPIIVGGKDGYQGNIADWLAPGFYDDDELQELRDGTFVDEPYEEMLDLVAEWTEKGLFNPDYSSATGDDMSQALADGTAAFVFSQNSRATDALGYNPDAALTYMPVPTPDGSEPYLIGGEMRAYGVAKDGDHLEEALAFLEFLADPDRVGELAAAGGNAPGLTTAESDLGTLQPAYDRYVASGDVPLVPYFDRVFLPNGMWDTMTRTTDAVVTGQGDPAEATGQMATDFDSLYGQGD